MFSANPPGVTARLSSAHFVIAGCGGLGSNAAMMLVRAGVGKLTLFDFDVVGESNLNRQFFFRPQIGMLKTDALYSNLLQINPACQILTVSRRLETVNFEISLPLNGIDGVLECFDDPAAKAALIHFMLAKRPTVPIIAVNGIGGSGALSELKMKWGPGKLILIGDGTSDASVVGTLSTRVMTAAAMQAHAAITVLTAER